MVIFRPLASLIKALRRPLEAEIGLLRWCKWDSPDLSEVEEWLKLPTKSKDCGNRPVCTPLVSDPRFYPRGIPKVFVSLRFSQDVKRSQAVLKSVTKKQLDESLPYPIVYYQKMYRNGKEALGDWPEIPCLLVF